MQEIQFKSSADDTLQPAMFQPSKSVEARPLLVGLHQWSSDYRKGFEEYGHWCAEHDWAFIYPDFRGPNTRPEACGSTLVIGDIVSAVDHAKATANVDASRIYLVGVSGGGYTALLMAGRAPQLWAGVSAWCGITDLTAWYCESLERKNVYAEHICKACGVNPVVNRQAARNAERRSPITWLKNATAPLDICAGIHDGHTGSVPIAHSLNAYNLLAEPRERITAEDIAAMLRDAAVPKQLSAFAADDPDYGAKRVLFRRESGRVRITIFDGGHEIVSGAALNWLARQRKAP